MRKNVSDERDNNNGGENGDGSEIMQSSELRSVG